MKRTLETFIEKTMQASTSEVVSELLKRELSNIGFENVVFVKMRNMLLHRIVWADLPIDYASAYQTNCWDRIDPVVKYAAETSQPFTWDQARERAGETKQLAQFFEECRVLGVRDGVTIPLRNPSGQMDLISVSSREKQRPSKIHLPIVYAMAVQAWLRHSQLEIERPRLTKMLTKRELECLRWMRDGKTNSDIGDILGISEKTVQFHAANIFRALGVQSRLEAVVVGLQNGLITL